MAGGGNKYLAMNFVVKMAGKGSQFGEKVANMAGPPINPTSDPSLSPITITRRRTP